MTASRINGTATMIASAGLAISAVTLWSGITNRTEDQLVPLRERMVAVESRSADNSRRLDKDESWISAIIMKKMK